MLSLVYVGIFLAHPAGVGGFAYLSREGAGSWEGEELLSQSFFFVVCFFWR